MWSHFRYAFTSLPVACKLPVLSIIYSCLLFFCLSVCMFQSSTMSGAVLTLDDTPPVLTKHNDLVKFGDCADESGRSRTYQSDKSQLSVCFGGFEDPETSVEELIFSVEAKPIRGGVWSVCHPYRNILECGDGGDDRCSWESADGFVTTSGKTRLSPSKISITGGCLEGGNFASATQYKFVLRARNNASAWTESLSSNQVVIDSSAPVPGIVRFQSPNTDNHDSTPAGFQATAGLVGTITVLGSYYRNCLRDG